MDTASDGAFQPKEELLTILTSLGFSRNASIKVTNNKLNKRHISYVIYFQRQFDAFKLLIGFQSSDTCGKIHYYVRTN